MSRQQTHVIAGTYFRRTVHKDILMFLFEHLHQGIKCSTIYRNRKKKERDQLDHELEERQQRIRRRKTFNEVAVKFHSLRFAPTNIN